MKQNSIEVIKVRYTTLLLVKLDELESILKELDKSVFNFKEEALNKVEKLRKQIIEFEFNQIQEKED
jgi:hypothetical protein